MTEQCKQIGNAVPVRTAQALITAHLWDVFERAERYWAKQGLDEPRMAT